MEVPGGCMSLLDEAKLSRLDRLGMEKANRHDENLRAVMHAGTPPGFVKLDTPEKRKLWTDHLKRQAMREREGFAPGDMANAALSQPAVQQAVQHADQL